jgi:hypothetical protein
MTTEEEIIVFFLYVKNNEVYAIKKKKEKIIDGVFSQERQLYIIKENQSNNSNHHKLVGLSYFNFNRNEDSIKKLFDQKETEEECNDANQYYKPLTMIDTITFDKCIFKSINSVFYIYDHYDHYVSQNTTKKIILHPSKPSRKKHN